MQIAVVAVFAVFAWALLVATPLHIFVTGEVSATRITKCHAGQSQDRDGVDIHYSVSVEAEPSKTFPHTCDARACPGASAHPLRLPIGADRPTCGDTVYLIKSKVSGASMVTLRYPSLPDLVVSYSHPALAVMSLAAWALSIIGILVSLGTFVSVLEKEATAYVARAKEEARGHVLAARAKATLNLIFLICFAFAAIALAVLLCMSILQSSLPAQPLIFALVSSTAYVVIVGGGPHALAIWSFRAAINPWVEFLRDAVTIVGLAISVYAIATASKSDEPLSFDLYLRIVACLLKTVGGFSCEA